MNAPALRRRRPWLLSFALFAAACSRNLTTPSSSPGVSNVASVRVGIAGDAPPRVAPALTLQLWAQARHADDTSTDITNLAVWHSSNTAVASVAAGGQLTGRAEGEVDVTATYQGVGGSIHARVAYPGCEASTLSPVSLVFSPFGRVPNGCGSDYGDAGEPVTVQAYQPTCQWTAHIDVDWLSFSCFGPQSTWSPNKAGSGMFRYVAAPNTTPDQRIGHIVVSFADGAQIVHTVTEEAPHCSYTLAPPEATFGADGGAGFFDVTAVPSDCVWKADVDKNKGVVVTSGASGTGPGRVTYQVGRTHGPNSSRTSIVVSHPVQPNPTTAHQVYFVYQGSSCGGATGQGDPCSTHR